MSTYMPNTFALKFGFINLYRVRIFYPTALFFLFAAIWVGVTYKIGDWRNWRTYYPTILFFWCGDFIYNLVYCNKPLWLFSGPLFSHRTYDFICMFTVFTCTTIIFLTYYPQKLWKQGVYIFIWVAGYSLIELIFTSTNSILYFRGWTLGWSIVHNAYQFILLRVHHKNPIAAWISALSILGIVRILFK